ncbi:bile acid:sodium symporter family protein [Alicyclobacillus fastidiosus]|uniref:Bile acid:sodium symporter family protein n=1 Tax=Alicyclobacillus fastidiosus TaxID=392011 RepID=A0ABV5AJY0_9BACL|nr:bile acid:sodium symporter family protein [Alicyclobacillus fastidiosus]WEH09064.1 bile acid:sodium symporter family protein [Alicyclobacillus fastidiosus]
MLKNLNKLLEKILPLITPCSIVIGVLLGARLAKFADLSPLIFGFMTFAGSLNSKLSDLKRVFTRPLALILTLFILHIAMPLVAFLVGHLFFHDDSYITTGLILSLVIPAGITSFIWVSIYNGDIGLTLSVILIDSLLSPLIVPISMHVFVGTQVSLDTWSMMKGLCWMIVLPSLAGMLLNQKTGGTITTTLGSKLAPLSKLGIAIVVAMNGAVVGPYLRHFNMHLIELIVVVVFLSALGYPVGLLTGKLFRLEKGTIVSMTFNGGMRNNNAGAVMAITYFPSPVALPVILVMLFQQTLASLYGSLLKRHLLARPESKTDDEPSSTLDT